MVRPTRPGVLCRGQRGPRLLGRAGARLDGSAQAMRLLNPLPDQTRADHLIIEECVWHWLHSERETITLDFEVAFLVLAIFNLIPGNVEMGDHRVSLDTIAAHKSVH